MRCGPPQRTSKPERGGNKVPVSHSRFERALSDLRDRGIWRVWRLAGTAQHRRLLARLGHSDRRTGGARTQARTSVSCCIQGSVPAGHVEWIIPPSSGSTAPRHSEPSLSRRVAPEQRVVGGSGFGQERTLANVGGDSYRPRPIGIMVQQELAAGGHLRGVVRSGIEKLVTQIPRPILNGYALPAQKTISDIFTRSGRRARVNLRQDMRDGPWVLWTQCAASRFPSN